MQDTGNQNAAGFLPVKDNMLALLHAPQPRASFITRATERGIIGKELAKIFKLADIAVGLDFAPGAKGIKADVETNQEPSTNDAVPLSGLRVRRNFAG